MTAKQRSDVSSLSSEDEPGTSLSGSLKGLLVFVLVVTLPILFGWWFLNRLAGLGDQPPPSIEFVNENDFDVFVRRGAEVELTLEQIIDGEGTPSPILLRVPRGETVMFTTQITALDAPAEFCINPQRAWFFFRIAEGAEVVPVEPDQQWIDPEIYGDSLELIHTLGPGFCHESRTGDEYIIGEEPWRTFDDFQ